MKINTKENVKYFEENRAIFATAPSEDLEKIILAVAKKTNTSVDNPTQRDIRKMHSYALAPQTYGIFPLTQFNFGYHRIYLFSDGNGRFFDEGDMVLNYLFNDAGDSEEKKEQNFKEIKNTFNEILEKGF